MVLERQFTDERGDVGASERERRGGRGGCERGRVNYFVFQVDLVSHGTCFGTSVRLNIILNGQLNPKTFMIFTRLNIR